MAFSQRVRAYTLDPALPGPPLTAAGIIEESESARGERGRVGQGRVGFRV